jgi:SAM-dependent MidA family methyltransferase
MENQLGNADVVSAVKEAIHAAADQRISFRDYMALCLYHEPSGYYRNEQIKIGKQGDFYTSSSVGTIMGEMIASYIERRLLNQQDKIPIAIHIVEWGGGNGRMALQILDAWHKKAPDLYARLTYTLIESSPFHRQLQRETLVDHAGCTRFLEEEAWLNELPQDHVYVLANELLDAFPVHRFRYQQGEFQESYVMWEENGYQFHEVWFPLASQRSLDYLSSLEVQWSEGQVGEMNLEVADWYAKLARRILSGSVIAIDYGDLEGELFAAHRQLGTLMCYRKHEAHDNPFIHAGEQDITAHVNFSLCQLAATSQGFDSCMLQTQRQFLVEQGILEMLQNHFDPNPFSEVSKRNRSIRQLLLSDGMSELFKVFVAIKKGESA